MRIACLALLGATLAVSPVAYAQRSQTQATVSTTQAQATAPIARYLSGHTTTFLVKNGTGGPVHLTLALLPDHTGWLFSQAAPGGTLTPRLRYIYRWWIAQDGNFCYLYSSAPDRLHERSFWTCWFTGQAPDGSPALLNREGMEPLPVVSRTPGNGLEERSRYFLAIATRHYGHNLPVPRDPVTPPPP